MRRAGMLLSLLVAVLLVAGCSAMFDFNLFKDLGLDPVAAPTPADYAGTGGLDRLAADLASPAVIDALIADPTAAAALESYLEGIVGGTVDSPEEQQAAILLADLELKTTNGEELVNNIVDTLLDPGTDFSSVNVRDLLLSIVPAEVANNRPAFTAMINGLLEANSSYFALGQYIDVNKDGLMDADKSLPPGSNGGDIAQKATVAFIAAVVMAEVDANDTSVPPSDTAHAVDQMFNLLYDAASCDAGIDGTMTITDPFAGSSDPVMSLKALYDAAGMTFPV